MVDARKQKPAAVDVYLLSRVDIVIRYIREVDFMFGLLDNHCSPLGPGARKDHCFRRLSTSSLNLFIKQSTWKSDSTIRGQHDKISISINIRRWVAPSCN